MVMSERSVNLTTLFLGRLRPLILYYLATIISSVTGNPFSWNKWKEGSVRRKDFMSTFTYVCAESGIEPGISAV